MEILENSTLEKHPEKLEWLKNNNYERVASREDWSPYKESKKPSVKKAVKKMAKKMKKK